eukprot:SAG31_NODE_9099_length_1334_cov_1.732794_2_plen_84_part_00
MSLVTICTHPVPAASVSQLTEVLSHTILIDENVTTVGFMMDALHRLSAHSSDEVVRVRNVLLDSNCSILPYESLCKTDVEHPH